MKSQTIASMTLAAAMAVTLTACGPSEPVDEDRPGSEPADETTGEGSTEYPLTVENCGREVTVEAPPTRVVSLDQNSTEILLSLGLEDRLIGTASWTDPVLPALAEAEEDVPRLSDDAPTYEVVLDADPDFITASFGRHFALEGGVASRERFDETGMESYLSPTDCEDGTSINGGGTRTRMLEIDTLYTEIHELAAIFDVPSRGEALVADLEERAEDALDGVDADGATVAFWFADTRTPYMAGAYGSAARLAEMSGMENVLDDAADDWPAVGWETIVERDPDVLVLGDLQRARFPGDLLEDKIEFLTADPLARTLDAVEDQEYIALHGAEMNPSIRFVDGLEKIGEFWKERDAE
ncbi:ABC transporter substrate-binding protein [Nesterenkonia sp. CL21]|uniref:ABC transporter substrate-binding protein n=1 Tax=Nesterenkonia sp. CL21 TaxID=3064894 RepID=UPI00287B4917|nr:ABC transporter substrate-binding protein [Nesterenkonia sp. CL21]MDS2173141.1 ABC transporter substrate-binding protein [Nesterenkonia sp. CL21]